MLVIRSEQVVKMRSAVRAPLHARILAFLRETMPEALGNASEAVLLARIADADVRAMALGVETERSLTLFAALTFQLGPRFDEIPQVRRFFDLPRPSPDLKVRWYFKALAEYKRREGGPPSRAAAKVADAGRTALGLLVALIWAPFVLGSTDAMLMGGAATGAGLAVATDAAVAAAAAVGTAVAAAAASPVVLTVLAVALLATAAIVVAQHMSKADEKADATSEDKVPTEKQPCPNAQSKLGPGTLTPEEEAELQDIADRHNTDLDVVGSRAEGKGRNIDKPNLPTEEKGEGTRSDIDVKIDPDVDVASGGKLSNDVANAGNGAGKSMNKIGPTKPPYIRFSPGKPPVRVE